MTERLFESHVTTNFNDDFREEFLYWPQKKFYPAYFKIITNKVCHRLEPTNHRTWDWTGPVRDFQKKMIRFGPDIAWSVPVRVGHGFLKYIWFLSESDPDFSFLTGSGIPDLNYIKKMAL